MSLEPDSTASRVARVAAGRETLSRLLAEGITEAPDDAGPLDGVSRPCRTAAGFPRRGGPVRQSRPSSRPAFRGDVGPYEEAAACLPVGAELAAQGVDPIAEPAQTGLTLDTPTKP
ncbi:hypothetical protein [Nonomuraea insulae]|uniref:Uncharacterized protein n=1 Tax=Nonomuraea insulae TaxID=1616787 RepID=A0ABW1D7F2_9ACTN